MLYEYVYYVYYVCLKCFFVYLSYFFVLFSLFLFLSPKHTVANICLAKGNMKISGGLLSLFIHLSVFCFDHAQLFCSSSLSLLFILFCSFLVSPSSFGFLCCFSFLLFL